MPNIKSAKKRVKVTASKALCNQVLKSRVRTAIKKFIAATESGNKQEATAAYQAAVKLVDRAAAKGIFHKNKASHKKSELTLMLNKMA